MQNEKRLDLIDRQALGIGRCNPDAFPLQNRAYCAGWNGVISLLEQAPTVDAVEVVHGYWIERPLDNFRKYEVKCSECGFIGISNYDQYLEPIDFYFCPRCGAQMDGLDGDGNG